MWGTRPHQEWRWSDWRFTPTHVGNTAELLKSPKNSGFTPTHVGNTRGYVCVCLPEHGSPPRMWGTPLGVPFAIKLSRFTPTHVGNTAGSTTLLVFDPVHPHACGEHGH